MKKYCVIVAAGSGARMGNPVPKQFLELLGKPLLAYSVEAFTGAFPDISIIVVMHANHLQRAKEILSSYSQVQIVAGANTRSGSVKIGLDQVDDDSIVFVHDGVRCLVTPELIHRCYAGALEKGNAVPAVSVADSLRIVKGQQNEWLDRSIVRRIQTPQTFRTIILKKAYELTREEEFTDDALVAERSGVIIHLVEGDATNIKITYPVDLLLAEMILKQRQITV